MALLGLSLYTLIGGLFLGLVAVLFYFMWLSEDIPALLAGEVPQGVIEAEAPTDIVHVLDMAWILPANILTAIWLSRSTMPTPSCTSRSCTLTIGTSSTTY